MNKKLGFRKLIIVDSSELKLKMKKREGDRWVAMGDGRQVSDPYWRNEASRGRL